MEIRFDNAVITRPGFHLSLDLSIPGRGITAIIGPSGAGKSTILNVIAGFAAVEQGRLTIDGRDMAGVGPATRPVTMVFQDNNLFPHLTVSQNVGLGLDPGLRLTASQEAARDRVLAEVGLAQYGGRRPGQLSGGQQSRTSLARALLRDRPILLLDEPFAALGPGLRDEMMDLVRALQAKRGINVLIVTHNPEDAKSHAADTIFVEGGRAIGPTPTDMLFNDAPATLQAYLGRSGRD